MRRALVVLPLLLSACSGGVMEGAFLSETIPLVVEKQEKDHYSVKLNDELLFLGKRVGKVINLDVPGKAVTLEYSDDFTQATFRGDTKTPRTFTRVPKEELTARVEKAKAEAASAKVEKKEEQKDLTADYKKARQALADKKYAEAKKQLEDIVSRQPDFAGGAARQQLEVASREVLDEQRLDAAEQQLDKGDLASAEATLKSVNPETLQAVRRGKLSDKLRALKTAK